MKQRKKPALRFKGFVNDWEQRKFKNEVKISNEMVDPKTGLFDELIHIGPGDIEPYTGQLVSEIKTVKESDLISGKFHFYKGDIIYSKIRPELSKCIIAPEDGLASADAYVLHGNENICQEFLYCILQTRSFYSYSTSVSMRTGMPKINREELGSYDFYAPSIKEQRTIGNFLIGLDKLITLHQRKLEKLQNLKKSMLEKMFPKNGAKVPEIRFKGFTNDWEQRKLGDFGAVAMCKRIFKDQTSEKGDIPFYKIGTFGGVPDAYIPRELFNEYKQMYPYPEKGDILISASGSIGRTVEYTGEDAYFQDSNIVWLRHGKSIVNLFLKYLYEVIQWAGIEGSTIKRLYNDNILTTEVMIPSVQEQEKIGAYLDSIDHLITLHQRKLRKLQNLKKAMLEKMFI